MQMITRWMIGALVLGLGCGGAQVEPPGDDSEAQGTSGAATTTGTTDTLDTTGAASLTETGTTTEVGTTAPTTGEATTTTDTGGADCVGPDGCFNCAPKQPLELLNACTDAACSPFENTQKRLPLLNGDGTLPPLP